MRLDRKQLIAGLPVKIVRHLLGRDDRLSLASICERLCLSQTQARELIKDLKSMELIETDTSHKSKRSFWRRTIKGNAFCGAKFLKPIPREKALKIIDSLLERVKEVNKNDSFKYAVTYVGLFGSLSKGAEEVGDIDLIIDYQLKRNTDDSAKWVSHDPEYYAFHSSKVKKFIKDKNPYISITRDCKFSLKEISIFPKQIFPCA